MDTETIDQVNQIKRKLTKYTEKKPDVDKVNGYLELLSTFHVNNKILKETDIYKHLKELKKKENPSFSQNAANLMSKWKTQAINNANEPNCKYEPTSINTLTNQDTYNPTPKHSSKPSETTKKFSKITEQSHKSEDNKSKKRTSDLASTNGRNVEKKPKLSLSDYKTKKPYENMDDFDMFDVKSNKSSDYDETSSHSNKLSQDTSDKYGLDFNHTDDDQSERYSPTPIVKQEKHSHHLKSGELIKSNKKHSNDRNVEVSNKQPINKLPIKNQSDSSSSKNKKKSSKKSPGEELFGSESQTKSEPYEPQNVPKNIVAPPMPSAPIEDLFSKNTTSMSYEPTPKSSSVARLPTNVRPAKKIEPEQSAESVEEALQKIMKMKQSKRMLYTGKKNNASGFPIVPKLFDLSARSLINNLDTLPTKISTYNMTHDFAIAFELIKPVLEQASAKQLENIENYSPHLLSDTDYIWRKISESEFKKTGEPDEDESWREYYFKKLDDREQMFQRARNKAKEMQRNKAPERVTQMATMKPAKTVAYLGPKSYNGPRSGQAIAKHAASSTGAPYTKSAPKVVMHHERKPAVFSRAPPVMSQGMRATMKMFKSRRK